MAELVILEVVLGFAYNKLLEAEDHAEHGLCRSDPVLSDLKCTVYRLKPKIDETVWLNQRLDQNSSDEEICELFLKAEQIVNKCSEIAWWKFWKKYADLKKLKRLDFSHRRLIKIDLRLDQSSKHLVLGCLHCLVRKHNITNSLCKNNCHSQNNETDSNPALLSSYQQS